MPLINRSGKSSKKAGPSSRFQKIMGAILSHARCFALYNTSQSSLIVNDSSRTRPAPRSPEPPMPDDARKSYANEMVEWHNGNVAWCTPEELRAMCNSPLSVQQKLNTPTPSCFDVPGAVYASQILPPQPPPGPWRALNPDPNMSSSTITSNGTGTNWRDARPMSLSSDASAELSTLLCPPQQQPRSSSSSSLLPGPEITYHRTSFRRRKGIEHDDIAILSNVNLLKVENSTEHPASLSSHPPMSFVRRPPHATVEEIRDGEGPKSPLVPQIQTPRIVVTPSAELPPRAPRTDASSRMSWPAIDQEHTLLVPVPVPDSPHKLKANIKGKSKVCAKPSIRETEIPKEIQLQALLAKPLPPLPGERSLKYGHYVDPRDLPSEDDLIDIRGDGSRFPKSSRPLPVVYAKIVPLPGLDPAVHKLVRKPSFSEKEIRPLNEEKVTCEKSKDIKRKPVGTVSSKVVPRGPPTRVISREDQREVSHSQSSCHDKPSSSTKLHGHFQAADKILPDGPPTFSVLASSSQKRPPSPNNQRPANDTTVSSTLAQTISPVPASLCNVILPIPPPNATPADSHRGGRSNDREPGSHPHISLKLPKTLSLLDAVIHNRPPQLTVRIPGPILNVDPIFDAIVRRLGHATLDRSSKDSEYCSRLREQAIPRSWSPLARLASPASSRTVRRLQKVWKGEGAPGVTRDALDEWAWIRREKRKGGVFEVDFEELKEMQCIQ
ncbi:hypothetical protein MMC25_004050 [Agyrium rufum]|nr:hypothetical protein [Agyrium rufum]